MLSCHDLAHKVGSDYLDGHLDWRKRMTVAIHLFMCANCRRFIGQLKLVRRTLFRLPAALVDQEPNTYSDNELQGEEYLHNLAHQLLSEYKSQNAE